MEFFKKIWHGIKICTFATGRFFKRTWLAIWSKIKQPHGVPLALFYVFFVCLIAGTLTLVILVPKQTVFNYILYAMSAISLAYFVYTMVIFIPKLKTNLISFLKRHELTNRLLSNYGYRTFMFSIFSFILNIAYVIFQGVFAFSTLSPWYISITAYYLILSLVKGNVFFSRKLKRGNSIKEAKNYRFTGIMLMLLTLALSGMIILIYKTNMHFEYAGLMIFVVATYTFYNLTFAIINIFKARKHNDLHVQNLRNINLVHALFSIVVLQVAMFQAFSPEHNKSIANALTAAGISAIFLTLGIFMIIKANKTLKQLKETQTNDEKEEI